MVSAGVHAQESDSDAGPRRTLSMVPRVSITETVTDNVRLTGVGQQSEQITEISPGIHISSEGGRFKGYFDYSVNNISYANSALPSQSQNALNTFGTLEAIDNWAYIDFSGSISQQTISAFGTQSNDRTSINANRTEVSSYLFSPYVRGRFGDLFTYVARYGRSFTHSEASAGSDVISDTGVVSIKGSAFRNLGWLADASHQRVDYSPGRLTEADRLTLGLSFAVMPQLNIFANAGTEANNYTSLDRQSYETSGFGVNWSPSAMTKISASRDHRSFGEAHNVSFEHITARTVWRYTDSKDVVVAPSQSGISNLGSVYDLLYSQFASIEPNPAARAQLVNAYLQANSISPNTTVSSNFLTSAVSLQRRQDLSFALLGVRDTVTFIATRIESSRLDAVSTAIDDFTTSSLIRQRGFSVNYAHRLTPGYSLGVLLSQQNTAGSANLQDTKLRSLNVNVTGKVGKQATVLVGVRRNVSSSGLASYAETAVIANLIVQF